MEINTLRLELIIRATSLLRKVIEHQAMHYTGMEAPNLQSIIDLCSVEEQHLPHLDESLRILEKRFK